jgi:4-amino-4-deoxy-L-arabinose transferase-like glycosyltransferase
MWRRTLLVLLFVSVLLTPSRRDLFVGDETKYGQVVREMRTTGAFFLPTLNGTPFTHKPPLHFWLVDLLTFPFGAYSTWAFVLPSLLAFVFLLWLLTRMRDWLAAFVCGTSLMVWGSAQTARMDVGFTAFLTLGCWWMYRFFEARTSRPQSAGVSPGDDGDRARRPITADETSALLFATIAIAIATLIKGPMAPVIALILFALECWRRRGVPRANYLPALAALIVIPLLWLIPALIVGGNAYAHDVIVKQTVGRAFSTWVHKAPPWYYLLHAPADLFPWFFAAVAAIAIAWKRNDPLDRFCISWIIAVLLPYSLMSSKLDVYMMAMIPPVAILIAGHESVSANRIALGLLAIAGIGGWFFVPPQYDTPAVRGLLIVLALASIIGAIVGTRVAVGATMLVTYLYIAVALTPMANDLATTRPLITALAKQQVPAQEIALYSCPQLWSRDMPRELERVRYVAPEDFAHIRPLVVAVARKNAKDIAPALNGYRVVDSVQMIGKPFDVYRR